MSYVVLQVDETPSLLPFDYERSQLAGIGGTLLEAACTSADEVAEQARDADVLWLSWKPQITGEILERLPRCRLVVRWGIGYDQIDVDAATELGVAVANAPTYGTIDVAEHALTLLMCAARRITFFHNDMRNGGWTAPETESIHRLQGRTVGLIGVGRIGAAFARLARGVGLNVIGVDEFRTPEQLRADGVEPTDLAELVTNADFLSLHVPLSESTRGLISDDLLRQVKPGAILVNTSRGPVIDEAALIAALDDGRLAAAALDVFAEEPLPADSPLRTHPGIVLTPHYAGLSAESWHALKQEVCATTIEFLQTGWADGIVNPQVRSRLRSPR